MADIHGNDMVKKMVDIAREQMVGTEDTLRSLEGCDGEAEQKLKKQLTKILRRMRKETEEIDRLYGPDRLLKEEARVIGAFIEKRKAVGISQADVARKMGTQKASISRMESATKVNKHSPSLNTLIRYADAIGHRVRIKLIPTDKMP